MDICTARAQPQVRALNSRLSREEAYSGRGSALAVRDTGEAVRGRIFTFAVDRAGNAVRRWLHVCSIAQIRKYRYAARRVVMICDSSRSVAPSEISERISRSKETDGSPASILATRDWLD
jgi:hypothetical protein